MLRGASLTSQIAGILFLATLFCVTWEKVHWNVGGAVGLADVLAVDVPRRVRARAAGRVSRARP